MNTSYEFHLMQLADTFFPSGMFGMSWGLESFFKNGIIKSAADVLQFIRRQMRFQILPCDCVAFANVMDAAKNNNIASAVAADNRYYSMRLVKEARTATSRSGRQLLNCLMYMHPQVNKFAKEFHKRVESRKSAGTYPACLAVAAYSLGIPKESALRMMLYSYSVNIVGAAVRLGIIQHLDGQKTMMQLAKEVGSINFDKKTVDEMWQLTPLTDILQIMHEHDDLRMFIT